MLVQNRRFIYIASWLFASVCVAAIIWWLGPQATFAQLRRVDLGWFTLSLAGLFAGMGLRWWKWHRVLRNDYAPAAIMGCFFFQKPWVASCRSAWVSLAP